MRNLLSILALSAAALNPAAADNHKPNLVTILTAPEPQTQLMAMVLSMQSLSQGASVKIMLCGPAGDLALRDAPDSATAPQKPKGMSPQGLMQQIMKKGGKVEVCAIYLPNKALAGDALIDGISPAKPPEMAASLLADNTRIISF
ncbi:MAG: hypothetical protein V2J55_16210 [Candidatus Competibacteraceae bacterium]|nr:hypothetical protein [Candidatus Competibacteraceae bacterium]